LGTNTTECNRTPPKQIGSNLVYPFVGALRRKNNGHQQLIRIGVLQLRFGNGHFLLKILNNLFEQLFSFHSCTFSEAQNYKKKQEFEAEKWMIVKLLNS
jgi:hypothetical protein